MRARTATGLLLFLALVAGCQHLRLERGVIRREGDWPMFGRTSGRSGAPPSRALYPLEVAWQGDLAAGMAGGGVLAVDSVVYAGTMRGELCAFRATDGKKIGAASVGEAIHGAPVIQGNLIYIPLSNSDAGIRCYNLPDGKTVWSSPCGEIEISLLSVGTRLYAGTLTGEFLCLNAGTGERLWSFRIPENRTRKGIRSSPAAWGDCVIFGADDGFLYALDTLHGDIRWKREIGAALAAPPVADQDLIFIGSTGGRVAALDAGTGNPVWVIDVGSPVTGHALCIDSTVFVGTNRGVMLALDRRSGEECWRMEAGGPLIAGPVSFGDCVVAGTTHREVVALRQNDGKLVWRQRVEGRVKTPLITAWGLLFVATDDRTLWAFRGREEQ